MSDQPNQPQSPRFFAIATDSTNDNDMRPFPPRPALVQSDGTLPAREVPTDAERKVWAKFGHVADIARSACLYGTHPQTRAERKADIGAAMDELDQAMHELRASITDLD